MARTKAYSDFESSLANLVGTPVSRLSTDMQTAFNSFFNSAISNVWVTYPWGDICPTGEARFVGNRLTYANNFAQTTVWTATGSTLTANSVVNPLDGRINATRMMETTDNTTHQVVQAVASFLPSIVYSVSVYARWNGRDNIIISVNDGVTTHSSYFDILEGETGDTSNITSASITACANGFYLCKTTFTANAQAAAGTVTIGLAKSEATSEDTWVLSDGDTVVDSGGDTFVFDADGTGDADLVVTYEGSSSVGVYLWGALVQQASMVPQDALLIEWEQDGEYGIESVFDAYQSSPASTRNPIRCTYDITTDGIQLVNTNWTTYYVAGVAQNQDFGTLPTNPIYLYYRKLCPSYTGDTFDAAETYAVDEQAYFTTAAGKGNYYKCLLATSAAESPTTAPTKWQLLEIPEVLFQFCLYQSYGDWLIADGQMDKAAGAFTIANMRRDDELDKAERQQGKQFPMRVQTHTTVQRR